MSRTLLFLPSQVFSTTPTDRKRKLQKWESFFSNDSLLLSSLSNFNPYLSFFFYLLLPNPSLLSPLTLWWAQGIEPGVTVVVDFPLSVSVTFFWCHCCGCFPSPPQVSLYLSLLFIYNYFLSLFCSLWCLFKSVYCFWIFGCEGIWRTSAGHVRLLSATEEGFPFFCLFGLFTWWESWGIVSLYEFVFPIFGFYMLCYYVWVPFFCWWWC